MAVAAMANGAKNKLGGATGAPRVLAPSLGHRINGAPVRTPAAIPWGYQAGVGVSITLEITHNGDDYIVRISPDKEVEVRTNRAGGGHTTTIAGEATRIAVMRRAAEAMEDVVAAINEIAEKYRQGRRESREPGPYARRLSTPAGPGRAAYQAPPDSQEED